MTTRELGVATSENVVAVEAAGAVEAAQQLPATQEVLDARYAGLIEQAAELEKYAKAVAKGGDNLLAGNRLFPGKKSHVKSWLALFGAGLTETVAGAATGAAPLGVLGLHHLVAAVLASGIIESRSGSAEKRVSQTGDVVGGGNAIQALRAERSVYGIKKGDVVAVIHPRRYDPDEVEPRDLAASRLSDALYAVDKAPTFKRILIPATALKRAGLPIEVGRKLKDTVEGMTREGIGVTTPYEEDERVMVVDRQSIPDIMKMLEQGPPLKQFDKVLTAINERFSLGENRLSSTADRTGLRQRLRSLLIREIKDTVMGATRELNYESVRQNIGTGPRFFRVGLETRVVFDDLANPRVVQFKQDHIEEGASRLAAFVGDDAELFNMLPTKLEANLYDRLELTAIGLKLLEQTIKEESTEAAPDDKPEEEPKAPPAKPALGAYPKPIEYDPTKSKSRAAAYVGKVMVKAHVMAVAGSSLVVSALAGVGLMLGGEQKLPSIPPLSIEAFKIPNLTGTEFDLDKSSLFRVDVHGNISPFGYYSDETSYDFDPGKGWADHGQQPQELLTPPVFMADESVPHLTISTAKNDTFVLPILDRTKIAAMRVFDAETGIIIPRLLTPEDARYRPYAATQQGEQGLVHLIRESDGQVTLHIRNHQKVFVEYDLIVTTENTIMPYRPLQLDTAGIDISKYPTVGSIRKFSREVREKFIYDHAEEVHKEMNQHMDSPADYVRHMEEIGRCDCGLCNTYAGMLLAAAHPNMPLTYVGGWLMSGDNFGTPPDHIYLADIKHAWLDAGNRYDVTATRQDERSVLPKGKPMDELDKMWSNPATFRPVGSNSEGRGIVYAALAVFLATAAVGLELKKKWLTNGAHRALLADRYATIKTDINPEYAMALLGWEAYGGVGSRVPTADDNRAVPFAGNIPQDVLKRVVRGEVRLGSHITAEELRGVRNTARLLLRLQKDDKKDA